MSKQTDRKPRAQRNSALVEDTPGASYRPQAGGAATATPARPLPSAGTTARPAGKAQPKRNKGRTYRRWDWLFFPAAIAAVVAILWLLSSMGASAAKTPAPIAPPLAAGATAPAFTLPDTNSNTVSLSDYQGKVVVVEFMAPWCPHCQEDAPVLNQLAEAYEGQDVAVLAVSATPYGKDYGSGDLSAITMDDMTWFRDTFQVRFPLLFDENIAVGPSYGVSSYPTIYVIDAQGKVSAIAENPPTVESLSALIEQARGGN